MQAINLQLLHEKLIEHPGIVLIDLIILLLLLLHLLRAGLLVRWIAAAGWVAA